MLAELCISSLLAFAISPTATELTVPDGEQHHYVTDTVPFVAPDHVRSNHKATVFVNFDGAELVAGQDDSRTNTTFISQLAGTYPPFGGNSKRGATLQAVRTDFEPYGIVVVDERPESGEYAMAMVGPKNVFGGGVLGIAPLDCYDGWPNNVVFAFHSDNDQFSPAIQATTIGQEVAHSYGLEHVDEPGDIMNPFNAGGDPFYNDKCIQIVSNQGIQCGAQHAEHCGAQTQQNSHQELLGLFGPSTPDTTPPSVVITYPSNGDVFEVGADFEIAADAQDDQAVESVALYVDGSLSQTDDVAPYTWSVSGIPEGVYELQAIAIDTSGNEAASDTVTIAVGTAEIPTTGGTDATASGTESGGTDSGGGADSDKGCGCRSNSAPVASGLLVFLALLVRRRRS